MMLRYLLTILLVTGLFSQPAAGQSYAQAKASFEQARQQATSHLSSTIDEKIKQAAGDSDMEALNQLLKAKNDLTSHAKLPEAESLQHAVSRYRADVSDAAVQYLLATQSEILALVKAGKTKEAQSLSEDAKELVGNSVAPTAGGNPIAPATPKSGETEDEVVSRAVKEFRATYASSKSDHIAQLRRIGNTTGDTKTTDRLIALVEQDKWDASLSSSTQTRVARAKYDMDVSRARDEMRKIIEERFRIAKDEGNSDRAAWIRKIGKDNDVEIRDSAVSTNPRENAEPGESAKPREIGEPADSIIIDEDIHAGIAANHPAYTKATTYTMKIPPDEPKVRYLATALYFKAYQPEDKANTHGKVEISIDYGQTWMPVWKWQGADMKAAKRRNNWTRVKIASGLRENGQRRPPNDEIDELQVRFAVIGTVEEIHIDRVVWTKR